MANILHVYLPGTQMTPIFDWKRPCFGMFWGVDLQKYRSFDPSRYLDAVFFFSGLRSSGEKSATKTVWDPFLKPRQPGRSRWEHGKSKATHKNRQTCFK